MMTCARFLSKNVVSLVLNRKSWSYLRWLRFSWSSSYRDCSTWSISEGPLTLTPLALIGAAAWTTRRIWRPIGQILYQKRIIPRQTKVVFPILLRTSKLCCSRFVDHRGSSWYIVWESSFLRLPMNMTQKLLHQGWGDDKLRPNYHIGSYRYLCGEYQRWPFPQRLFCWHNFLWVIMHHVFRGNTVWMHA